MGVQHRCQRPHGRKKYQRSVRCSPLGKNDSTVSSCHNPPSANSNKQKRSRNGLPKEQSNSDNIATVGPEAETNSKDAHNKNLDKKDGALMVDVADAATENGNNKPASNSFTSIIKMNEVDEEEALDRLMYDLSNDEVSMVIDLFGKGCGIGPARQYEPLPTLPHVIIDHPQERKQSSVPVALPTFYQHEIGQRSNAVGSNAVGSNDKRSNFRGPYVPLPRSLFHHPSVEHLGFNALNTMACCQSGIYGAAYDGPRPEVVTPTISPYLDDYQQQLQANNHRNYVLLNHNVFHLPMDALGVPFSASLAEKQQMDKKRSEKKSPVPVQEAAKKSSQTKPSLQDKPPVSTQAAKKSSQTIPIVPKPPVPTQAAKKSSQTTPIVPKPPVPTQAAKKSNQTTPIVPKPPVRIQVLERKEAFSSISGPQNKLAPKKKATTAGTSAIAIATAGTVPAVVSSSSLATKTSFAPKARKGKNVPKKKRKAKPKTKYGSDKSLPTFITFPKITSKGENRWNTVFEMAQEFAKKHGHCRIPTTYTPNPELANWARRQRCHYSTFKKYFLDRPDNPAVISGTPSVVASTQAKECTEDKEQSETEDEEQPESKIRVVKCLMTTARLKKLEAIDFCLDLQNSNWERMYERLVEYSKKNNGRTYPSKHVDPELWKWVGTQRYQMNLRKKLEKGENNPLGRKGNRPCLTPERIAKLNEINFVWDDRTKTNLEASKIL